MASLTLFKKIKVHTAILNLHSESYYSYYFMTAKYEIALCTWHTDNYVH